MGLTGLQIFKLLPGTNCRDCGYPTCLAFAMKLAAGKESLDKCPTASEEAKAALGAASAPPIRGVTIGRGEREVTVGEETVFFRHEKTFVRPPALFRLLDPAAVAEGDLNRLLDAWAAESISRAGEVFRVDGVAVVEAGGSVGPGGAAGVTASGGSGAAGVATGAPGRSAGPAGEGGRTDAAGSAEERGGSGSTGQVTSPAAIGRSATAVASAMAAVARGLPVALLAATAEGAAAVLEKVAAAHPLLAPPAGADLAPYVSLAARHKVPLVVSGADLDGMAAAAAAAAKAGVEEILLEPAFSSPRELHRDLTLIRRGALARLHPGLAWPVFLRLGPGEVEKGALGIAKFASLLAVADPGGEIWLPLWTLRQNIYTDPQKPLQMAPGLYAIGEPGPDSPLLVTTNFSLTYFIVSTELEGTGLASHLAVIDAEGMSVLTAWSAGKFSGERVGKALKEMGALERVAHRTAIIPGYVAVISGELEDTLGGGWRVLAGPQEASDLGPFFRDVWEGLRAGR